MMLTGLSGNEIYCLAQKGWAPGNIDRLCNGTRNARNTIACFQSNVESMGWAAAIDKCK